ncbi:MAG: hypothetical protein Q9160_002361 [Pyrenula sp. 1 TL-2023]
MKEVCAAAAHNATVGTHASRFAIRVIEKIEKDLENWVQRLRIRLTLLSRTSRVKATEVMARRNPALQFQYGMYRLSSGVHALRAENQTIQHDHLWLPVSQSVDSGDLTFSRRMRGLLVSQKVCVEFIIPDHTALSPKAAREVFGELAFFLNRSNPAISHTLRCVNIYVRSTMYGLIFQIPSGVSTLRPLLNIMADTKEAKNQTVRNIQTNATPKDATISQKIGSKIRIAYHLAVSLRYLHSFGYVHQSVRSSNVLIGTIEHVDRAENYLGGFERLRPSTAASNQHRVDTDWRNNVYRSPHRIVEADELTVQRYMMSHDIYSLGVVLLELGL